MAAGGASSLYTDYEARRLLPALQRRQKPAATFFNGAFGYCS